MDNHLQRPEVRDAVATGEGAATRYSDSVLMDMVYFARSIGDAGGSRVLRVAVPLRAVNADLRRLLWSLGTAGAGLLLVTILLVYIVSRGFSRMISSLSKRASEMAAARTFEPVEEPPARELAPLVRSLNNVARRLHDRIDELQVHQLEHEAILQSMNSGVIALDLDHRILRLNRAAEGILGISSGSSSVEAKRITLSASIAEGLAGPINQQLIEQAIANYVSNAIKYSPTDTTVTVTASISSPALSEHDSRKWIVISVTDEGAGIAREHLPRVFERFYRVDKARSRELGGTGLGLAIVKHIALVHGGRVDVESHLDKGSTFRLLLPVSA